jgi:hypothetical protein
MKKEKLSLLFITLILFAPPLLIIPLISPATIVQAQPTPAPEAKTGFVATIGGILASPIFWGALLFLAIIVVVAVILFFLIRWIISFFKSRNDIYYNLKKKRIYLAGVHKTYKSKHFWKVTKNTPIRLVKKGSDGKFYITNPIAYHRGDYITSEGNLIISFNMEGNNRMWLFPIRELLIIPNFTKIKIPKRKGEKTEYEEIENIPTAKEIVQFNDNEILLYAEGISHAGQFYVPVLRAKDGKIIDLTTPIYQSLKEVVLGDYLYVQTSEFVAVAKKGIDMNPNLRYIQKTGDANQSVEAQPPR